MHHGQFTNKQKRFQLLFELSVADVLTYKTVDCSFVLAAYSPVLKPCVVAVLRCSVWAALLLSCETGCSLYTYVMYYACKVERVT